MKIFFIFIFFSVTIGLHTMALAKPVTLQVPLKHIDQLAGISADLDLDTTKVLLIFDEKDTANREKNCFCSCRDGLWSCTRVACRYHNGACENYTTESLRSQNH